MRVGFRYFRLTILVDDDQKSIFINLTDKNAELILKFVENHN